MRNQEVISKWVNGLPARSANLRSDGDSLFSYSLKIGSQSGRVVYNYMSHGGGEFISATTSQHVSLAKRSGFRVENP